MAKTVTRDQVATKARLLADERTGGATGFISDTEIALLINDHAADLYERLVKARGHEYYCSETTLSIVAGTSRYNLPADFWELYTATLEWGSTNHELVHPYEMLERPELVNLSSWSQGSIKGYRLRNTQIEFLPTPGTAVTCRLQYVPAFQDLASGSATLESVNGWDRHVALSVAIDMRTIAGLPASFLMGLLSKEDERIEELAAQRDAGHPARVVNVYPEGGRIGRGWWP